MFELFREDERGVSAIIGAILLFGMLIVALAGYQATIVPQQNAATEFEHMQQVENELLELKTGMSTAGQANTPHFQTVKLGTTYQQRLFTINPRPATGTLETSETYDITISDGDETVEVETRFVSYTPRYFELDTGSLWIDNSVLVLDERYLESRTGNVVVRDEQNLVTDGERLKVTAVQNEFREQGVQRVGVRVYPTRTGEEKLDVLDESSELDVRLPTRLTEDEYWSVMSDEVSDVSAISFEGVSENVASGRAGDIHELQFTVESIEQLQFNTIGIGSEPVESPGRTTEFVGGSPSPGPGPGPSPGGDVEFVSLSAEVTDSGASAIREVSFESDVSEQGVDVEFTVVDDDGVSESETVVSESGVQDVTVNLGELRGNNRPVTVTADIDGGECKTTEFEETGSSVSELSDWDDC